MGTVSVEQCSCQHLQAHQASIWFPLSWRSRCAFFPAVPWVPASCAGTGGRERTFSEPSPSTPRRAMENTMELMTNIMATMENTMNASPCNPLRLVPSVRETILM